MVTCARVLPTVVTTLHGSLLQNYLRLLHTGSLASKKKEGEMCRFIGMGAVNDPV